MEINEDTTQLAGQITYLTICEVKYLQKDDINCKLSELDDMENILDYCEDGM